MKCARSPAPRPRYPGWPPSGPQPRSPCGRNAKSSTSRKLAGFSTRWWRNAPIERVKDDRSMTTEDFENNLATALADDIGSTEPAMIVDVEGFEGPLDLLLTLARQQKVDLHKISILALADQYLMFIAQARKVRLELAADYLVMAAWLAYLKSRLLLPEAAPGEGPSAEDMAMALANRLRRLEAIREAAAKMMERPQLGRDVFERGLPE